MTNCKFSLSRMAAVTLSLVVLGSECSGQTTPPPSMTKESAVTAIKENVHKFEALTNLNLSYTLTYSLLAGKPRFGFARMEVKNIRNGDKLKMWMKGWRLGSQQPSDERACTWNGIVGMERVNPSVVSISNKSDNLIYYYSYYTDFLGFPGGSASLPTSAGNSYSRDDYWLPDVLDRHLAEYTIRPQPELVNGSWCAVLERPGADTLWLDYTHGFALRRRDSFFPSSGTLRMRTYYEDFRELNGLWLPWSIVREEFGGVDQPKEFLNKLCARKFIKVQEAVCTELSDAEFRLPVNDGETVQDQVRKLAYKKVPDTADPLEEALQAARSERGFRRYLTSGILVNTILWGCVVVAGVVGLWWVLRAVRAKRARQLLQ